MTFETLKEFYPDVQNTKVVDVVNELQSYGTNITIFDPLANPAEVRHEYNLETTNKFPEGKFDAVVLTVAHKEFLKIDLDSLKNESAVVYDVKNILPNSNGKL